MPQSATLTRRISKTSFGAMIAKDGLGSPSQASLKNITLTAGIPVTVFQFAGGPGVITSSFMRFPYNGASTVAQNGYTGVFSVYVDGEASPSLTYDVGGPLMYFASNVLNVWTANMASQVFSSGQGSTARCSAAHNNFFPIPWHRSIIVIFTPTQTMSSSSTFVLTYVLDAYFPYKLCSQVMTYDQTVGVNGGSQYNTDKIAGSGAVQFLNIQGASGYIVYSWLCVYSSTNADHGYCETNIAHYYNNNNPPATTLTQATHSMTTVGGKPDDASSGTEDYFRTAFFGITLGTPSSAPANCRPGSGHPSSNQIDHFTVDHLETDGGLRFDNGAVIQWETGANAADTFDFVNNPAYTPFGGTFYYIDYP